jgi:hypothetical protein
VHRGAAAAAEQLLVELPAPARRLYLERYGPSAEAALARARTSGDRDALARVARRYPLTQAARDAWWSLGDFEFELGELEAARAAWQRAARATSAAGLELPAGAQARLELAFPAELQTSDPILERESSLAPPGADAQSWRVRVDEPAAWYPFLPGYQDGGFNLLALCARDLVLVSNSLRLLASKAWWFMVSFRPRGLWISPPPVSAGLVRSIRRGSGSGTRSIQDRPSRCPPTGPMGGSQSW